MNPIHGLVYGFSVALTPGNIGVALLGVVIGTVVGVLPGMGPTLIISLLLAPTATLSPESALIMLGAVYYGTQYGDSMTAILMNVPSEAPSVVIGRDGYQMTLNGRAGKALSASAVGSFFGATTGLIGLMLLAGPLSQAALKFGPPQFFEIGLVGLFLLVRISQAAGWRGIVCLALGLAVTTIGQDPVTGTSRLTFGVQDLVLGFDIVPVVMGLIGFAEILEVILKPATAPGQAPRAPKLRSMFPSRGEWREVATAGARGAVVGFIMGMLPGPTLTLATFVSYRIEQLIKRRPGTEAVGKGAIRAVAGPKAADDAAVSGNLVPLMALGIPFSPVTAVLFAGLVLHGIEPGPLLISQHPEIFWGLAAAMYIGNVALLFLNFPLVGIWTWLLRIPQPVLSSAIVLLMLVGAFSLRNNIFDVYVMVGAGVLGFIMKQLGFNRILVILGVVLGPVLESNFREALQGSSGNPATFVHGPISIVFTVVFFIVALWPLLRRGFTSVRRPQQSGAA